MKKMNNVGSSKFQVLVALLVMAVIAGGAGYFIYYLTKRFSSEGAELQKQTAASKAEEVYERVAGLAADSDIDFDFDHATASCIGVSQRGFTVITISSNILYITNEPFEGTGCETDDEKVEYARNYLGDKSGDIICEGIKYFGISTSGKAEGTSLVTIKAVAGDESNLLEKEITLNEYVVKRANGIEIIREKEEPKPSPETIGSVDNGDEGSDTSEQKKDETIDTSNQVADVNNIETTLDNVTDEKNETTVEQPEMGATENQPQSVQKPEEPKGSVYDVATGRLSLEVLKASSADSEIEVEILCASERAKAGWCVGGIGIGQIEISENECFQYKLSADPTVGKIYVVRFAVCDLLAELRATGEAEAYMSFYNGFEILGVKVAAPKN